MKLSRGRSWGCEALPRQKRGYWSTPAQMRGYRSSPADSNARVWAIPRPAMYVSTPRLVRRGAQIRIAPRAGARVQIPDMQVPGRQRPLAQKRQVPGSDGYQHQQETA